MLRESGNGYADREEVRRRKDRDQIDRYSQVLSDKVPYIPTTTALHPKLLLSQGTWKMRSRDMVDVSANLEENNGIGAVSGIRKRTDHVS